jgi:hypothetical protein
MARSAAPGRTAKKRKERRPYIPAGTVTNPVEVAVPEPAVAVATPRQTNARVSSARAMPRFGVPLNTDYRYVAKDLRQILIISGILIAVMIALALIFPNL